MSIASAHVAKVAPLMTKAILMNRDERKKALEYACPLNLEAEPEKASYKAKRESRP